MHGICMLSVCNVPMYTFDHDFSSMTTVFYCSLTQAHSMKNILVLILSGINPDGA